MSWLYDDHGQVRRELYAQSNDEVDERARELDARGSVSSIWRHWVYVDPQKWAIAHGTDGWMEVLRADLTAQKMFLLVKGERGGGFIGLQMVNEWATTARAEDTRPRQPILRSEGVHPAPPLGELLKAVRIVVETFKRDEAQGYRSRDRQYAIEMLEHHISGEATLSRSGDPARSDREQP